MTREDLERKWGFRASACDFCNQRLRLKQGRRIWGAGHLRGDCGAGSDHVHRARARWSGGCRGRARAPDGPAPKPLPRRRLGRCCCSQRPRGPWAELTPTASPLKLGHGCPQPALSCSTVTPMTSAFPRPRAAVFLRPLQPPGPRQDQACSPPPSAGSAGPPDSAPVSGLCAPPRLSSPRVLSLVVSQHVPNLRDKVP